METPADWERLYRSLRLIRRTEEEIARVYPSDKVKSPVHLSIGQEAVAVGICDVLRADDLVSPTYRSHATYIAKGGDLKAMFAELYGKVSGSNHGKGGSMHMIDMSHGVLGASAVVGTTIPIAAGFALALEREGKGRIVTSFFGDGGTEEGAFFETLNFAALHKLPILFVCENNGFAIHTPIEKRWATRQLVERVRTFGMPAHTIEDSDVLEIRRRAAAFIAPMREGGGPAFLECRTYRWREHVGPGEDYDAGYRERTDLEKWQATDAVAAAGERLDAGRRRTIDTAIEAEIAAAIDFAEKAEWPPIDELLHNAYAD